MYMFLNSDLGRGVAGIIISIVITLAALLPVLLMDWFSKLITAF